MFHALLQCIRPHDVRKQIAVRALRKIKYTKLVGFLDKFGRDQGCVDVDIMVEQYAYAYVCSATSNW